MNRNTTSTDQVLKYLLSTVLISTILYFGKSLFIPISVALLVSFLLYPLCKWQERHRIPKTLAIFLSLTVSITLMGVLIALLSFQFGQFMKEWPELSGKVDVLIINTDQWLSDSALKVFMTEGGGVINSAIQYISQYIVPIIPKTLYESSISFMLLLLIPVYSALILYYRDVLVSFLFQLFPKSAKRKIEKIIPDVIHTYYNFIKGMGLVYLIVGVLNSIGLAIVGVPNPIFFGFIASILTFIPYVGITIGAILPMAISWLKYDSAIYPIGVIIVFSIVQVLEANVIFPLAVSFRLKINALITLIVIVAGGIIWGAMGMILFLPFVAILKLIADQVESMRPIAILLGTKEDIDQLDKGK